MKSKKSGGIVLIACTLFSLVMTNSIIGTNYLSIWNTYVAAEEASRMEIFELLTES